MLDLLVALGLLAITFGIILSIVTITLVTQPGDLDPYDDEIARAVLAEESAYDYGSLYDHDHDHDHGNDSETETNRS